MLARDRITRAFNNLRTQPARALAAAEVLLEQYGEQPALYIHIVQLKARALLGLKKADDCIAFINSLGSGIRTGKALLMCKARALQVKGCLHEALLIFQRLYATHRGNARDNKIHGLALGRALEMIGGADNLEQALAIYTQLRSRVGSRKLNSPCDDKDIELTLGRLFQRMGGTDNLEKALAIYTRLRSQAAAGKADTACNDKEIELTLGRCLQLMGGADNLQKALVIFTRLRTLAAGRANTPCNDKDIELTLGRHLQIMRGTDNLAKALAIYTRLRLRAAGKANTPCNDKEIELALGRLLQMTGGADNLDLALAIFTRLRRRAAGRENSPCNDKVIEVTLGRHLQLRGGAANLKQALAIFTRLRTQAAQGKENTPCDDPEIELTLAGHFIEWGMWAEFDALQLETRHFPGFESHLCLSVRNFHELVKSPRISSVHSRLLGQALRYAALAVENSGFMNASCISQLGHCLRVLSYWPQVLLQECAIAHNKVRPLLAAAKFLFDTADEIAPYRLRLEKDQYWREKEQQLLALLS